MRLAHGFGGKPSRTPTARASPRRRGGPCGWCGRTETLFEAYTAGEKDYTALVSKLKAAGIEVLFVGGYHTEAGLILLPPYGIYRWSEGKFEQVEDAG